MAALLEAQADTGSSSRRLLQARLDVAYRRVPYAVLAGVVGMLGLWLGIRQVGLGRGVELWLVLHAVVAAVRLGLYRRFQQAARPVAAPRWWYAGLAGSTAAMGLVWCGFTVSLYAEPVPTVWAHLALLVLFAILSVTPLTLGVLLGASLALLIPIAAAAFYAVGRVFGDDGGPVITLIAAWIGLMLLLGHRTRADHARITALQMHNEDLLSQARTAVARTRQSEERLRTLLTLSTDWYWEMDSQFRFVRGMDPGADPRAHPFESGYGKAPWDLPGSAPIDTTWEAHRAVLDRQESFRDLAIKRVGPDGAEAYLLVSGAPMRDANGHFCGYRGTTKDITHIKRIEAELAHAKAEAEARNEQLRASEEKFRTLVGLSSDWYWERDAEHRLLSYDGSLGNVDDRPRLPVGSLPWDVPYIEPVGSTWEQQKATVAAREPFRDLLLRLRLPGQRERYLLVSGAPVFAGDGRFLGYRGTSKDVTEQQRVEQELALAKQTAEAGSRAKSQFLANMSHEIRTPMNGILGALQLLARTELTTDQRKLARIAQGSAESLLQIIDDILDFSKIEAGKLTIEQAPFELAACVRDAVELLRPRAVDKGLAMHCTLANGLTRFIQGDAGRLRQVLLNLLGNAVKFTASGEISVQVDCERPPNHAPMLRFAVRDSGIGIDPAVQAQLFQAFNQGDNSMHRRYGGTGLGLAISKYLVEAMGGEIGVESTPGQGTTFWFWLPLQPVADEVGKAAVTTGTLPRVSALKVLVVEDNPVNRDVARTMLRYLGAQSELSSDGANAVSRIESGERYDAILMDCQMPGMDGFEATRRIRAFEARFEKPRSVIVALTANAMQGDRERCLEVGMDDYLAKPYSIHALGAVLARWTQASLPFGRPEDRGVAGVERTVDDGQKKNL